MSASEGSYSPSGSTPSGVLPDELVTLESHLFTELVGIQCLVQFNRDVKQHLGGLQYTVMNDQTPVCDR